MIPQNIKIKNRILPDIPGVYLMKDARGKILYIGKAGNLRRRVESYFSRPHDSRIQKLVSEIRKIDYRKTDTALEALILEAELIKKFSPPFNVREKDDKSFLYVEIINDTFPRVLLVRGKDFAKGRRFGPFTSGSSIREALKIIRRIFPFSTHEPGRTKSFTRPCLDYEIGLCPGTCAGEMNRGDYLKNIKNLILFFGGKKKKIIQSLSREMQSASKKLDFERAEKLKRQVFALEHIRDIAFITEDEVRVPKRIRPFRIEGYDISNISGTSAVGSMVVFIDGKPEKDEYRKFRIRTISGSNDTGMIKEILRRRLGNPWQLPDLVLVDGGAGQIHAVKAVFLEFRLKIPVIGIVKGPKRKRNDILGIIPKNVNRRTLIQVRDEAHRFAIGYHRKLRSAIVMG